MIYSMEWSNNWRFMHLCATDVSASLTIHMSWFMETRTKPDEIVDCVTIFICTPIDFVILSATKWQQLSNCANHHRWDFTYTSTSVSDVGPNPRAIFVQVANIIIYIGEIADGGKINKNKCTFHTSAHFACLYVILKWENTQILTHCVHDTVTFADDRLRKWQKRTNESTITEQKSEWQYGSNERTNGVCVCECDDDGSGNKINERKMTREGERGLEVGRQSTGVVEH